jgi:hypothetical protein
MPVRTKRRKARAWKATASRKAFCRPKRDGREKRPIFVSKSASRQA